ncbi:MAG: diaminopimelate epimerase [Acidimicrobiales bacterium]|nr:diaminopimelate epimerase [Acidimicrobiales bacterium]
MIRLSKHHGLGNDFLVAVEPARTLSPTDALAWCDRRRGVGADGLIAAEPLASDGSLWSMALWNADGSRAEVSGNGIRCLAQAIVMSRGVTERAALSIRTDGGIRQLEIWGDRRSGVHHARVSMGAAAPGPDPYDKWELFGLQPIRQQTVNIGNPHLVVEIDDPELIDLTSIGPEVETNYDRGINLHLIRVDNPTSISLYVWERGAGVTEACGSGASAAAWATNRWGLTESSVTVRQPGGDATVDLADDDEVFLTGPTTYVAHIDVPD